MPGEFHLSSFLVLSRDLDVQQCDFIVVARRGQTNTTTGSASERSRRRSRQWTRLYSGGAVELRRQSRKEEGVDSESSQDAQAGRHATPTRKAHIPTPNPKRTQTEKGVKKKTNIPILISSPTTDSKAARRRRKEEVGSSSNNTSNNNTSNSNSNSNSDDDNDDNNIDDDDTDTA